MPLWITQLRLKSKNPAVRREALQQLCQSPNFRAFSALTEALRDEDAEVRKLAAIALGKLEDGDCLEPLLGALRDSNAEVQMAAIQSLKRVPDEKAVKALLPLLQNRDAGVRGHAAHVLQMLGWRPATPEEEIWFWAAKGQFPRLASFGAMAIPALELVVSFSPYGLSVGAIQALASIDDSRVLPPLLEALKENEAAVCVAALDALGRVGSPQVIEPVIKMLRHQNSQVRLAAIESLAELRAISAAHFLRELLQDAVWDIRRGAAEALGKLKDSASLEVLTMGLQDGDADVREACAVALGRLGDPDALGPLVMALKDSSSGVRRVAAASLSRIDADWSSAPAAAGALEALKPALDHEDSEVRYFVGHLLRGLGKAQPEAIGTHRLGGISFGQGRAQKLAVNLFLAILGDVDRDLRQAAAEALGRLNDARAQPALGRALSDADTGVRAAAQESLRQLAIIQKTE